MRTMRKMGPWLWACALSAGLAATAVAGTKDGGGGMGVLCGGKLRVLDLFEAEVIRGVPAPTSPLEGFDANIEAYGSLFAVHYSATPLDANDPLIRRTVLEFVKQELIGRRLRDIPAGERLPLTDDATLPVLPPGCKMVQLAWYDDPAGIIWRDREYWDRLSARDQAALIFHEYFYYQARLARAKTSDDARWMIGTVFSGTPLEPVYRPTWNAPLRLVCTAGRDGAVDPRETFSAQAVDETRDGIPGVAFYFLAFKNQFLASRVQAFLPGRSLDSLVHEGGPPSHVFQAIGGTRNESWDFELKPGNGGTHLVGGFNLAVEMRAWLRGQEAPPFSNGYCFLKKRGE